MKIAWTRPALRHIGEIQDFIAEDNPSAAHDVANALLDRTIHAARDWPEAFD